MLKGVSDSFMLLLLEKLNMNWYVVVAVQLREYHNVTRVIKKRATLWLVKAKMSF